MKTQTNHVIFPLIKYVALHAAPPLKPSPCQPVADAAVSSCCMLTGFGSPANKPVVEKCSYGVKSSPALCHYPVPCRVEGDHHFHITNRRLLFFADCFLKWKISFRQPGVFLSTIPANNLPREEKQRKLN